MNDPVSKAGMATGGRATADRVSAWKRPILEDSKLLGTIPHKSDYVKVGHHMMMDPIDAQ